MKKIYFREIFLIAIQIVFLFILSHPVSAELSLTIGEAVRIALENRYELSIAESNIRRSKAELLEAKSELYPKIDLTGSSSYTETIDEFEPTEISLDIMGTGYNISPTKDVPEYRSSVSMELTQRLFSGGRIIKRIEGAKERIDLSEVTKEIEKRDIILLVINAYWDLKRAERILEITNQKLTQLETVLNVAESRYEKGAISRLQKDKAASEAVNAHLDLIEAETNRKMAIDKLLNEMGIIERDNYSITLMDEPEKEISLLTGEVDDFMETALSKRPELQQIKKDIRAKEADVKVAKSRYFPQIDLKGEYNWTGYDRDDMNKSWDDIRGNYWSVFLVARFNIFEGFLTKSRVTQARARLHAARLERDRQRQSINHEVKEAYNRVTGTVEKAKLARRNTALAEKNLEGVMKEFELGVVTIDKVADYNVSLADARERYINALIDLEKAKVELRRAAGEDIQ